MMKAKVVSTKISSQLYTDLVRMATANGMSVSEYLRKLIEEATGKKDPLFSRTTTEVEELRKKVEQLESLIQQLTH